MRRTGRRTCMALVVREFSYWKSSACALSCMAAGGVPRGDATAAQDGWAVEQPPPRAPRPLCGGAHSFLGTQQSACCHCSAMQATFASYLVWLARADDSACLLGAFGKHSQLSWPSLIRLTSLKFMRCNNVRREM